MQDKLIEYVKAKTRLQTLQEFEIDTNKDILEYLLRVRELFGEDEKICLAINTNIERINTNKSHNFKDFECDIEQIFGIMGDYL